MAEELRSAYFRGLPYPILSVLEYFSLNQDAFDWGRHYRTAGHYTSAAIRLDSSKKAMLATGLSALLACLVYLVMSPCQLQIGFVGIDGERILMKMSFQWAFYAVFAAGILAVSTGLLLILLQYFRVYTLSTFLAARLDEDVIPTKSKQTDVIQNLPSSIEVMRHTKGSSSGSVLSEKKTSSSGFQSRTSYTGSLRSQSSFESVHGDLGRSPSNLTINDDPRQARSQSSFESVHGDLGRSPSNLTINDDPRQARYPEATVAVERF
ncbi:unnamed protein product [Nippostrongylus brasiliensis]|uniref:DUOXA-like protein (inferred by orthology to a C. elegans protein) n=1 Tax=Nippostrongylus brasiliensis TaxID=27835 RepID=A0A0N4YYE6_NIPBR|nr:unnamed protein product [Nippostrongylus brasiliensis]